MAALDVLKESEDAGVPKETSRQDAAQPNYMESLQRARADNERALGELEQSLGYRKNLPFDPMYMRMAAGFFKPTKTGQFGENVGYAAENAADQLEKDFAARQAEAKLKAELSGKKLALAQQMAAAEDFSRLSGQPINPAAGGAPSAGGQAAVASGATGAPSGSPSMAPAQVASISDPTKPIPAFGSFQQLPTITDSDIARASFISPDHGEKLEKIAKMQQEAIKIRNGQLISTPSGLFDVATNKYVPGELANHFTEITLPGTNETRKVSFEVAQGLSAAIAKRDEARKNGDPNADRIVMQFMDSQGIPYRTTTERTKSGQEIVHLENPQEASERKQKEEALGSSRKEFATKSAIDSVADEKAIVASGKQSYSITNNANTLLTLMNNPETKNAFGYFSDPTIGSAFVNFVSQGIDVRAGTFNAGIGLPALGAALKQANMTDQEIAAVARAGQIYGELKLQIARRDLAGEGSVSDGERRLVTDVSGSIDQPLKAAMASAELMKYRAEFDRHQASAYHAWRKNNPDAKTNEFYGSEEYGRLQTDYDKTMRALDEKYFPTSSGAAPAAPPPPPPAFPRNEPKTNQPASNSLPQTAVERLKRGVITKFANGSYWTLGENDTPVEVDSAGNPLKKAR
jgi:hypothetical protein